MLPVCFMFLCDIMSNDYDYSKHYVHTVLKNACQQQKSFVGRHSIGVVSGTNNPQDGEENNDKLFIYTEKREVDFVNRWAENAHSSSYK